MDHKKHPPRISLNQPSKEPEKQDMDTPKMTLQKKYTWIDVSHIEAKGELLIEHRKKCMVNVDIIRDFSQFDEASPSTKKLPEFFSLHMPAPPEHIMPCLRVALAFIHDEDDMDDLLYKLDWDNPNRYVSLIDFSRMRDKNIQKLIQIVKFPDNNLSRYKMEKVMKYMEDNKEAFDTLLWKRDVFTVPIAIEKIILQTFAC